MFGVCLMCVIKINLVTSLYQSLNCKEACLFPRLALLSYPFPLPALQSSLLGNILDLSCRTIPEKEIKKVPIQYLFIFVFKILKSKTTYISQRQTNSFFIKFIFLIKCFYLLISNSLSISRCCNFCSFCCILLKQGTKQVEKYPFFKYRFTKSSELRLTLRG